MPFHEASGQLPPQKPADMDTKQRSPSPPSPSVSRQGPGQQGIRGDVRKSSQFKQSSARPSPYSRQVLNGVATSLPSASEGSKPGTKAATYTPSAKSKLPQLDEATEKLLRQGAWPLLSPHPLDWNKGQITMKVGESEFLWPPPNMAEMSPDALQNAHQTTSTFMHVGSTQSFPTCSPAVICDQFNCLALPGQTPAPKPTDPAQKAAHSARRHCFDALRTAIEKNDGSHKEQVTALLKVGPLDSEVTRHLLELTRDIPLAPLWKCVDEGDDGDVDDADVERYRPSAPDMS